MGAPVRQSRGLRVAVVSECQLTIAGLTQFLAADAPRVSIIQATSLSDSAVDGCDVIIYDLAGHADLTADDSPSCSAARSR